MKIPVLVQGIGSEVVCFWLNKLFNILIVSDGDEWLEKKLKAEFRGKADTCASREVQCLAVQFTVDIWILDLAI